MAPTKKREARENNYYNVGVQGRKTGITLEDKGIYDEHGLEPVSGIFSSPERSPPKRGEDATGSGSMEIQNSSMPDLMTSHQILRNSRTNLPPPRSRSPKKTNLGSSPRRQSSMALRSSLPPSSPVRDSSQPIARRLDFEQDESSLQETPALSGSGARRGAKRSDVYDIPEDESPAPDPSAVFEESIQEEIASQSAALPEESFVGQIGDDSMTDDEAVEELEINEVQQDSEVVSEPPKDKAKRGRKRKSDVAQDSEGEQEATEQPRKRGRPTKEASESQKSKKIAPTPATERRRSQRVSDISEMEAPIDDSVDQSEQVEEQIQEPLIAPKRRGRPPKVQPDTEQEESIVDAPVEDPVDQSEQIDEVPAPKKRGRPAKVQPNGDRASASALAKPAKSGALAEKSDSEFARPEKPRGRPPKASADSSKSAPKPKEKSKEKTPQAESEEAGKLVDVYGNPLSKKDIDQMSATSGGSRFGRGRHLSVFREMDPDNVARVGRTGRHRVAPIDFWKNDHISYEPDGSMSSIVKSQAVEEERRVGRKAYKTKGKKKVTVEEEEIELDPWEEEGTLVGNFRGFDPVGEVASGEIVEDAIAWTQNGVQPRDVGDGGFKYAKIGSVGNFFNWGLIELGPDQMKRTKNSRYMHMIFNVQSGTVEVRMHENEFVVHKMGVWQVPRGNTYSIKNIGSGTARIFFSQARELHVEEAG
ncbi:cupin-like protein [Alternaria alternata]|nr:cupin-like protein [Alternaria alternata]